MQTTQTTQKGKWHGTCRMQMCTNTGQRGGGASAGNSEGIRQSTDAVRHKKRIFRSVGPANALGAVTMANAANGRNDRMNGGNAASPSFVNGRTGCALPARSAARRLASLTSERLIAALTIALESDVIDGLMLQTVDVADELTGLSELPATPTVLALRAEKTAEYRRLAAATNSVMASKAECYAVLRGGR